MSFAAIIIMIAALVAGFFFLKKFISIESYFFGSGDSGADESSSGILFLFAATAIGALATAWGIIAGLFDLSFSRQGIVYMSVSLEALVIFSAMAYVAFHSDSVAQMIGKMVFMTVSCIIGALMGAAGSVIVFAILVIMLFIYILGAALSDSSSSSSSSSSGSSSSSSSSDNDEILIDVPGETFHRRGRDIGFGQIRDDHGDLWRRNFDGSLSRDE